MHILFTLALVWFFLWAWGTWEMSTFVATAAFLLMAPVIWLILFLSMESHPGLAFFGALAISWWLARKAGKAFA